MDMIDRISHLLNDINNFLVLVAANFTALILWWVVKELMTESNVPFLLRMKNRRFNCLAHLYQEMRNLRLSGVPEEKVQEKLQEKFNSRSLPFMMYESTDPRIKEDNTFVGSVIQDPEALRILFTSTSFRRKEYNRILNQLAMDDRVKEARYYISLVLIDNNEECIDNAMKWIPALFTRPFTPNPDKEPNEKVGVEDNHFAVVFYTEGFYLKQGVSQQSFINCLNALRRLNPSMEFAATRSKSTECKKKYNSKNDKRGEMIRKRIKDITGE